MFYKNDNKSFIEKAIDNSNNNPEEEFFKLFGKIYDIVYINTIKEVNIEDNKIYAKDNKSLNKYLNKHIYEVYNNRLNYWYNVFDMYVVFSLKAICLFLKYCVTEIFKHALQILHSDLSAPP